MSFLTAPLLNKILGGVSIALAVALLVVWLSLQGEQRQSAKWRDQYVKASAQIDLQNAAIERMSAEAKAAQVRSAEALAQARKDSARAEATARDLERERPLSGRCETPKEVLSAGL